MVGYRIRYGQDTTGSIQEMEQDMTVDTRTLIATALVMDLDEIRRGNLTDERRQRVANYAAELGVSIHLADGYVCECEQTEDHHACVPGCRHRCPECRLGLGTHLPCDPQCEVKHDKAAS